MVIRIINVYVKEERTEDFLKATGLNRKASIEETGVLRFDILNDNADSSHFILYEVYGSDEATVSHKETEHYKVWKNQVEDMMAAPRGSVSCTPVAPTGHDEW